VGVVALITLKEEQAAQVRLLRVDSEPPGASIYLDRLRLGVTPYTFPHPRGDGELTLTLFKQGYRTQSVRFEEGSQDEVRVNLVPETGAPPPKTEEP
jgi:hypothetical protein